MCLYRYFEPVCEGALVALLLSCHKLFYHVKLLRCHFARDVGRRRWVLLHNHYPGLIILLLLKSLQLYLLFRKNT